MWYAEWTCKSTPRTARIRKQGQGSKDKGKDKGKDKTARTNNKDKLPGHVRMYKIAQKTAKAW